MNKKVLVTGSSNGIGKAIAEKFHSEGWDAAITGRNQEKIQNITSLLNAKREKSCIGIKADLSNVSEIKELKNSINQIWNGLDVLILNVGSGKGSKGLSSTYKENYELFRINFLDVIRTFRILLPLIKTETNSAIIFIGSIAQVTNVEAPITYSYAKRALNNYVVSQATRLAKQKISVNLINPGHILTTDGVWDKKRKISELEFTDFVLKNIPVGEIGKVENVASLAFSYVDEALSPYLIGTRINLDGGTSIKN